MNCKELRGPHSPDAALQSGSKHAYIRSFGLWSTWYLGPLSLIKHAPISGLYCKVARGA